MNTIQLDSFAKINLSLDVLEEREDGYHNIDTIMQLIDMKDDVEIKLIDENKCIIQCSNPKVPSDHNNLVHKAWRKVLDYTGKEQGIAVKIKKNIPMAAGLAGGSSNAAAVMKGLNELMSLNLTQKELMELGLSIGADVPYFFVGKTVRATGVGNIFEEIPMKETLPLLLVNNGTEISTKEVYDRIIPSSASRIDEVSKAISQGDIDSLKTVSYNTMEKVVFQMHPEIGDIKERLLTLGADAALMSGSGATVFSIFKSKDKLDEVYNIVKDDYSVVKKSETI